MTYNYGSGALGDWSANQHGDATNTAWSTADVGLYGDSITTRGKAALATVLSGLGASLAVNYWSGRPSTPAVDALLGKAAELEGLGLSMPRIIVMAVGTNDFAEPMVLGTQIQRVKDAALENNGVEHILWTDMHLCRTGLPLQTQVYDERNTALLNNQIHDAFDVDHIVDWNRWLNYRGITYPPVYLEDGVHPWMTAGTGHGDGVAFWADVHRRKIQPLLEV